MRAMRASLVAALLLAGCLAPVEESRLERAARKVPIAEGAEEVSYGSGCGGGCWSASAAFATIEAAYPGGTNVSTLRADQERALVEGGWEISETHDPYFWYENGTRTSGASVGATKDDLIVRCHVGQQTDLREAVRLECFVDRVE